MEFRGSADGLLQRTCPACGAGNSQYTQPVTIRDKFRVFRVSWDGKMMITIDLKKLPKGWNASTAEFHFKNVGDNWVRSAQSVVLAIPECDCAG